MSYKISAKNRRLKRTLLNIISVLKFESLNIETPKKIVLFWVIIWILSLFLNWTESSIDQKYIWNAFKSILGIVWYLLLILNIKTLFIIFNEKMKENMKTFFNFNAKDGVIIVFLWAFWLFLTINTIFIIENFSYFTDGILIWKWIILSIVWYIFIVFWWFLMLKSKTKTGIYIDGGENNENIKENMILNEDDKNNMKLPF